MKLLAQIKEVYGSALFAFRPVDALSLDGLLHLLPKIHQNRPQSQILYLYGARSRTTRVCVDA